MKRHVFIILLALLIIVPLIIDPSNITAAEDDKEKRSPIDMKYFYGDWQVSDYCRF